MPKPKSRAEAKEETRQALLAAGFSEFMERGLETPSLDDICARAGYTRGAFYVHFQSREDFYVAATEWVLRQYMDVIVTTDEHGDDLEQTIMGFAELLTNKNLLVHPHRVMDRLLEASTHSPMIRQRFMELVAEALSRLTKATLKGQEGGKLARDLDASQIAMLLVCTAIGASNLLDDGVPIDVPVAARTLVRMLGRGREET